MLGFSEEMETVLDHYVDMIIEESHRQNLIRFVDREEILAKHVQDIALPFFANNIEFTGKGVDIGSGAGFPGIILKLCFPKASLRLYESEKKKAAFLLRVVGQLDLTGCEVVAERIESAGRPESYDAVFSRAVAGLPTLLEYAAPLLEIGGKAYFFKGPKYLEEIEKSERARRLLGWESPEILPYSFVYRGETYHHYLLVYRKGKKTPEKFPRRPGTAVREPL
ncbi:MAG TPA: 16S rRNA (guanine(527)-N(7))-methyltransferase RsmG [Thermotogota bacterium]|nr:16S rRNA (guanine(527)-N(7))-methyltransferase RsmG [Thermotogota bacterium]